MHSIVPCITDRFQFISFIRLNVYKYVVSFAGNCLRRSYGTMADVIGHLDSMRILLE